MTGFRDSPSTGLRPHRDDIVDAAFLLILTAFALIGFRTTFDGWLFLLVGLTGVFLGILIGQIAKVLRQPAITVAVMAIAAFFLLGGALALRGSAIAGVIPTLGTFSRLAALSVNGWKQLLTTLPPVDGSGPLLTLPYILGLLSGAGGYTLARRVSRGSAPVLAPVLLLAAVIMLGTAQPAAALIQGVLFASVAVGWTSVRRNRLRPVVKTGSGRLTRLSTALGLLAVAGGLAVVVAPTLPGYSGTSRVVLRTYVTPPFDISRYPSPLVGFRKYTKNANLLYDQTLFVVKGLPAGQTVKIATLDGYDGSVWGATNGANAPSAGEPPDTFQRTGSTMNSTAAGRTATYTVTVAPAYAASVDLSAWVPTAGTVERVRFQGPQNGQLTDNFRFNLATGSGVVPGRLSAGNVITMTAAISPVGWANNARPYGNVVVTGSDAAFTSAPAAKWGGKSPGPMAELQAIAKHMRETGAYSDGGPGESQYLPGHSIFRLTNFLNGPQLVGTDEHYAAAFALIANQLGVPARVVVGAAPEADGTVRGKDVHAWVELHVGPGTWATVPQTVFMPDPSKKPDQQPPQTSQNANPKVIPPPNVSKPPSSLEQAQQASSASQRLARQAPKTGFRLPAFVVAALTYGLPPIALVGLVCASIIGLKAWRRRRRRARPVLVHRYSSGWREVLDAARDLGTPVPTGQTRREQARAVKRDDLQSLAILADGGVFGPEQPTVAATEAYWHDVDAMRKAMFAEVGRWRRIRGTLSLRSLLPARRAVRVS